MNLFVGPALLLALVIFELLILKFVRREVIPWAEITGNLNSGHILLWVFRGFQLVGYTFVLHHLGMGIVERWPLAIQIIFAIVTWDFLFYISHLLHHKWKLLWAVHVVHHQGEHFNISLGIRNSWYSSLTSLPFFLPLAILGLPVEVFLFASSVHYFIQFYNHTSLVRNYGWLECILITPTTHKVHHGINPEYLDKNCGGTFNVWDKMFGTFQKEIPDLPVQLGTLDNTYSSNPVWINNAYILKWAGIKKAESTSKHTRSNLSQSFISFGSIILFLVLLVYISNDLRLTSKAGLVFTTGIFFATIALGLLQDGWKYAPQTWFLMTFLFSTYMLLGLHMTDLISIFVFGLLGLHGITSLAIQMQKRQ